MNKADIQSLNSLYLLVEASKGPSYIETTTSGKFYYKDPEMTILHREDGPAFEGVNGIKEWWVSGKLHRLDGPAVEHADGHKEWWVKGKIHRLDGPAVERADGSKFWIINGKPHREDGPAAEYGDGNKKWWLKGKEFSEKEFKAYLATKQYNKTVQDRGRKGDVEGDFDF